MGQGTNSQRMPWVRQESSRTAGSTGRVSLLLAMLALGGVGPGCGQAESSPAALTPPHRDQLPSIVASSTSRRAPEGSDMKPEVVLARRAADGSRAPIVGRFLAAVRFRDGQAAVTLEHELWLIRGNGSRSLLARRLDGLPARAGDGSLVYAARHGEVVELVWLTPAGDQRRLAAFRGSATRLAPQPDRTLLFVGAGWGGVSGVWVAGPSGARCLTNCELRVGSPWGDRYRALPGNERTLRTLGDRVEWQTLAGRRESVSLKGVK